MHCHTLKHDAAFRKKEKKKKKEKTALHSKYGNIQDINESKLVKEA